MAPRLSRRGLLAGGLAASLTAACEDAGPGPDGAGGTALLTDAVVFDGERFTEHDGVVIRDGLIDRVGRGLEDGDLEAYDCGGRVLLPGLIDAHTHSSTLYAPSSLRFGVTAMLEMHGRVERTAREARSSLGRTAHADIWFADWGMTVPGGHPSGLTPHAPVVEGVEDVAGFVADRFAAGADYLKLFIAGTGTSPTLTEQQATAAVRAAHERERLAVAHVSTWDDALAAARAGVDVLVHLPVGEEVSPEAVELMAERRVPVVATLTVSSPAGCEHEAARFLEPGHPVADRLDDLQERDAKRVSEFCAEADLAWWRDRTAASIEAARAAGIDLLVGTDVGNAPVVSGVSLHHELELLVEAGLSAEEALAGASSKTADAFGLDDAAASPRAAAATWSCSTPPIPTGSWAPTAWRRSGRTATRSRSRRRPERRAVRERPGGGGRRCSRRSRVPR